MAIAEAITPTYIRYQLQKRNIKQVELAAQLDVTQGHLSHVISGTRWSETTLRKVADAAGLHFQDVLDAYRPIYQMNLKK